MLEGHGGNIAEIARQHGIDANRIIDFSSNVNPLGYPDGLEEYLTVNLLSIRRFPEITSERLRSGLAGLHHCEVEEVIVGNGSTEIIFLIPRAFRVKNALIVAPTYADYADAVKYAGGKIDFYFTEESDGFEPDPDELEKRIPKHDLVFICNPNNPTGGFLAEEVTQRLVKEFPEVLFVIDATYAPFVNGLMSSARVPLNVIELHSFTKIFGVPGLRLGYAISSQAHIDRLLAFKEPWTVNSLAQRAGEFLFEQREWVEQSCRTIAEEKSYFKKRVNSIRNIEIFDSSTHFFLIKILTSEINSSDLKKQLLQEHLLIRDCSNFVGLSDHFFRVAVQTREKNQMLLHALAQFFGEV